MSGTGRYSPREVAGRFVARAIYHLVLGAYRLRRRPVLLLPLVGVLAVAALAIPRLTAGPPPDTARPADAGERYIRALRDRDGGGLLASLSPEMRQAFEQHFGQAGADAAGAFFSQHEQASGQIVSYELIGRYHTVQSDQLSFYVARYQHGSSRRDVPYTLTIDRGGRVSKIE